MSAHKPNPRAHTSVPEHIINPLTEPRRGVSPSTAVVVSQAVPSLWGVSPPPSPVRAHGDLIPHPPNLSQYILLLISIHTACGMVVRESKFTPTRSRCHITSFPHNSSTGRHVKKIITLRHFHTGRKVWIEPRPKPNDKR